MLGILFVEFFVRFLVETNYSSIVSHLRHSTVPEDRVITTIKSVFIHVHHEIRSIEGFFRHVNIQSVRSVEEKSVIVCLDFWNRWYLGVFQVVDVLVTGQRSFRVFRHWTTVRKDANHHWTDQIRSAIVRRPHVVVDPWRFFSQPIVITFTRSCNQTTKNSR